MHSFANYNLNTVLIDSGNLCTGCQKSLADVNMSWTAPNFWIPQKITIFIAAMV